MAYKFKVQKFYKFSKKLKWFKIKGRIYIINQGKPLLKSPLKRPKGLIFVDFKGFAAFLFWFSRHLVDILYFVSTMGYADNEWLEECNNNCEKDDSISYITIGTTNLSNGWFY